MRWQTMGWCGQCLLSLMVFVFCERAGWAQSSVERLEDLEYLAEQLPQKHKNAFSVLPQEDFVKRVALLRDQLPTMDDTQFQLALSELVAALGDGHTGLQPDLSRWHYFPFNVRWFDDQITLIATDSAHQELLGAEIREVNGIPIAQVIERFGRLISHDNEFGLRGKIDSQFNTAEYLAHVTNAADRLSVELTCSKGEREVRETFQALPFAEAQNISWKFAATAFPLHTQKSSLDFWNDWLPKSKTVYFKYNRCRDEAGFQRLVDGTRGFIEQNDVQRFVLDLRDNHGGNSAIFRPLFQFLSQHQELNQPGRLFVIIGRGTFSSGLWAAYDMKQTQAVLVGEPTGGKPNHFGEVRQFHLPNSRSVVFYSTVYWERFPDSDPPCLEPDVRVPYRATDYLQGVDPFLNAALEYRAD